MVDLSSLRIMHKYLKQTTEVKAEGHQRVEERRLAHCGWGSSVDSSAGRNRSGHHTQSGSAFNRLGCPCPLRIHNRFGLPLLRSDCEDTADVT